MLTFTFFPPPNCVHLFGGRPETLKIWVIMYLILQRMALRLRFISSAIHGDYSGEMINKAPEVIQSDGPPETYL